VGWVMLVVVLDVFADTPMNSDDYYSLVCSKRLITTGLDDPDG
jgi:hypothetical protein